MIEKGNKMSSRVVIDWKKYRDKVNGCWMGKAIGGTLGGPHEGRTLMTSFNFYYPVPGQALPNDDLDLQLVWLAMVEECGLPPKLTDLARWWMKALSRYPWNEYGFCSRNLGRGLRPPVSGCFENYYVDEMGSPIRSEIWACLAPGDPQMAAEMAWHDSALDHAGGEGTNGEMFWAALQSAAFVENDIRKLIDVGLAMIPIHSLISRAVREAVLCHERGLTFQAAREAVRQGFQIGSRPQTCNAAANHGFSVLGLLYGNGFADTICRTVNCAFDTDCTGATVGATLGIMNGTDSIPAEWSDPIGDRIVLHKFTNLPGAPGTIAELTERTVALAKKGAELPGMRYSFGKKTTLPAGLMEHLVCNDRAIAVRARDPQSAVDDSGAVSVTLHYGGAPVICKDIAKTVGVSLSAGGRPVQGEIKLVAPGGWAVEAAEPLSGQTRFSLRARKVAAVNRLRVDVRCAGETVRSGFVILGSQEAKGYPSVTCVPVCQRCRAWEGACFCNDKKQRKQVQGGSHMKNKIKRGGGCA